jgi:ribosomal protein S18 acetylase RimI-like enzyme
MNRTLLRMERSTELGRAKPVPGILVRRWRRCDDHARIPHLYAEGFGRDPWPSDWDDFAEFDPKGVFIAESVEGAGVGFSICFRREDHGYISVVAVVPEYRRRRIASALVATAVQYLASQGLGRVRIDAYSDAPAAVATHRSLGFEVYETIVDREADPPGAAEE